jgi:hypothetical protein
MFYVFTNITFYVSIVILYYFRKNVYQFAYSKLLELASLSRFIQKSTSAQKIHNFVRQLNFSPSHV